MHCQSSKVSLQTSSVHVMVTGPGTAVPLPVPTLYNVVLQAMVAVPVEITTSATDTISVSGEYVMSLLIFVVVTTGQSEKICV